MKSHLLNVLNPPNKHPEIPLDAKWLSGEGGGSWFHIQKSDDNFIIKRFSPKGYLECSGIFKLLSDSIINLNSDYEFTYLSHCAEVKIIQNQQLYIFKRIENGK